jgi:ketosteroid isomerase-like protein
MKCRFLLFLPLTIIFSCDSKKECKYEDKGSRTLELISADKEFSAMSDKNGMKAAFVEYLDSNGVLIRNHQLPVIGANAIDYLIQQNDNNFTMTWEPRHAEVSNSGDLGFTYGVYVLHPKFQDTMFYGTYNSAWKKQKDGKWKLLLNSLNEGIENNQ